MFRSAFRSPLFRAGASAQTCRKQLHTLINRAHVLHDKYCMLKQTKQTYYAFRAAEARYPRFVAAVCVTSFRQFHATPRNEGLHFVPLLAGLLKSSTAIEVLRTTARIALTFAPFMWFQNMRIKKCMKIAKERDDKYLMEKVNKYMSVEAVRRRAIFSYSMTLVPLVILFAMIVASLERTPLTGRWRLILLSPEEEDNIASQLAGPGWYQAVADILAQEGTTPRLIPSSDWRLSWVRDTLRRLESVIPLLQREHELEAKWLECGPNDIPLPPPAEYPLRPRPRGSEVVRQFAELSCGRTTPPAPHVIPGPPYSLIVVDKPDSSNAFSYGFGPDGGGGIVVFSGFLDDILAKYPFDDNSTPTQPEVSWWSFLFGSLPTAPPASRPIPTEQQTSELAILLAHELSHLILSHHLETLSSGSIIWPGILSISADVVRAVLFPITMLFGPFVNDALAGVGKLGSGHLTQLTQYCTSQKQEVEADVVSARLLAHAGFDPRHAIRFWEGRQETERTAECSPARAAEVVQQDTRDTLPMRWMGSSHPMNVVRVERLKEELRRWELQREAARLKLQQSKKKKARP